MPRLSKKQILNKSKKKIKEKLENKLVYSIEELSYFLDEDARSLNLPKTLKIEELIEFLEDNQILEGIQLNFPRKTVIRYISKCSQDITYDDLLNIVSTITSKGYFSHYTAAFIHGLTNNIVKNIYFSYKNSTNNKPTKKLLQENIDMAFSKPARLTNNFLVYDIYKIVLLENTFRDEGILKKLDKKNNKFINFTDIEKTLIDISVRPEYAGGVAEVLEIYKRAKGQVSSNKLKAYLKKANYTYPYHQVVGFYLEHAGYSELALKFMEEFPIEYNFYLTNEINKKEFSSRWKIFYPSGLI